MGLLLSCVFIDSDFVSVHKHARKEFGQYKATSPLSPISNAELLDNRDSFNLLNIFNFSDMIAVPDFAFSGMENWGLIMYREAALLYQPGASSEANKQLVSAILSHELAHQVSC